MTLDDMEKTTGDATSVGSGKSMVWTSSIVIEACSRNSGLPRIRLANFFNISGHNKKLMPPYLKDAVLRPAAHSSPVRGPVDGVNLVGVTREVFQ